MKIISKISILFLVVIFSMCQKASAQQNDKESFANKVNNAVEQLTEGEFVLHTSYNKMAVGEDSLKKEEQFNCTFRRLTTDSLLGYQFKTFVTGKDSGYLYDGNNLWDQYVTGLEVSTKAEDANHIKQVTHDYYPLFASINNDSFKLLKKLNRWAYMTIIDSVFYKGDLCYKINIKISEKNGIKVTRYIYVAEKTFIPIAQVTTIVQTIGQAREITTFESWMTDLKLMKFPADEFTKEKLTGYTSESTYDPNYIEPKSELLPLGSIPPNLKLPLISGDSLQLSKLKGKVVVLYFWDKNNPASVPQIQYLQSLQNKYSKDKVVFVGIDCFDDFSKGKFALFLKKRNISMLNINARPELIFYYHLRYTPTMFIIGKDGKVSYTQERYNDNELKKLGGIMDKILLIQHK